MILVMKTWDSVKNSLHDLTSSPHQLGLGKACHHIEVDMLVYRPYTTNTGGIFKECFHSLELCYSAFKVGRETVLKLIHFPSVSPSTQQKYKHKLQQLYSNLPEFSVFIRKLRSISAFKNVC